MPVTERGAGGCLPAGDKAILIVSYGTAHRGSLSRALGGIEKAVEEAFPDWQVRRAFTSAPIRERLAKRDGIVIEDVRTAVLRAAAEGVRRLVVLPTHLLEGAVFQELREMLVPLAEEFTQFSLAAPLLAADGDIREAARIEAARTAFFEKPGNAVILLGHGTEASSNAVYAGLSAVLEEMGRKDHYVGTLTASPSAEEVLQTMEGKGYREVLLVPLMVTAGAHAVKEMAGEEEDSWKSVFEKAGYRVHCLMEGLGEDPEIQALYVRHAGEAMAGGSR